jgi:hypothetical protein
MTDPVYTGKALCRMIGLLNQQPRVLGADVDADPSKSTLGRSGFRGT